MGRFPQGPHSKGSQCWLQWRVNEALSQGRETGNWRAVWDEFRNWVVANAA